MPNEYERKFCVTPTGRDAALALAAGAPATRILDAYLPPRSGAGPSLRFRSEGPVDGPEPTLAVACAKVPLADGSRDELEWDVPLPVNLPACAALTAKTRAALPGAAPLGAVCTLDLYWSPAARCCPITGAPLAAGEPVLIAEVEGDRAAVDAFIPPVGWVEVTGRREWSAGVVAREGWPSPA